MQPSLRLLALAALAWLAPPALAQVIAVDQLERSWQVRSAPTLTVLRPSSEPRPRAVLLMMPGGEGQIVVVKQDPALTEQALLEHCRQHLTGYKMPRVVEFRTEPLPKSSIGKILRRDLRHVAAVPDATPSAAST